MTQPKSKKELQSLFRNNKTTWTNTYWLHLRLANHQESWHQGRLNGPVTDYTRNSMTRWKQNQERCMHESYAKKEVLYLETDISRVGRGAWLLWVKEGMTCPGDTVPDTSILSLIAFARKIPSSSETHYSNIEREALGIQYSF